MAKTVDVAFEQIIDSLKPSDTETAAAASHRQSIFDCLKANHSLKAMFKSGSFGHGTSVRGYSDVDYFAVFPTDKLKQSSSSTLHTLKATLQERFPRTEIVVRSPAIVIPFGTGASEKHEIIPCDESGTKNSFQIYDIPDRNDGWMKASPLAHNSWVNTINDKHSKKVKQLIRLIKYWNYLSGAGLRSFYIELRVAEFADSEATIIYKYDVKSVFARFISKELAAMQDPQGISGYVYPCTDAQKSDALSKLQTALTRAEKARTAESEGKIADAFYWWNMVFFDQFPGYY